MSAMINRWSALLESMPALFDIASKAFLLSQIKSHWSNFLRLDQVPEPQKTQNTTTTFPRVGH